MHDISDLFAFSHASTISLGTIAETFPQTPALFHFAAIQAARADRTDDLEGSHWYWENDGPSVIRWDNVTEPVFHVHNLGFLRTQAEFIDRQLVDAWPRDTRHDSAMFENIKDAYGKAGYSKHYRITDVDCCGWVCKLRNSGGQSMRSALNGCDRNTLPK